MLSVEISEYKGERTYWEEETVKMRERERERERRCVGRREEGL